MVVASREAAPAAFAMVSCVKKMVLGGLLKRVLVAGRSGGMKGLLLVLGGLILVANFPSLPFVWHYKVLRHWASIAVRSWLRRMTLLGKSREEKKRLRVKWLISKGSIGLDPWDIVTKQKKFAWPDGCDYNLHLSNSTYAKDLDQHRMQIALNYFLCLLAGGGMPILGGNYFVFHREIPMFSSYEIRISVGSWDEKWLYLITRFVTRPNNKNKRKEHPKNSQTPTTGTSTPLKLGSLKSASPAVMKLLTAAISQKEEPDGATLNCINVSETCFKMGRITVPPAIALALNGFSVSDPVTGLQYSRDNPPPHMKEVERLLANTKELSAFLQGGWRAVPLEKRWWDQALGDSVEEKRKLMLELVQGIRTGMDGAKAIY